MTEKYFWIVLRKNDSMLKRHEDPDSAEKEAIRLAEKEKDTFFILKTVDCYAPTKVESIPLEHEGTTGDILTHCNFVRGKCMDCGGDLPKLQRDVAIDWECSCAGDCRAMIKIAAPWSITVSKFLNSYARLICNDYKNECYGCIGPSEGLECKTCQSDMKERNKR